MKIFFALTVLISQSLFAQTANYSIEGEKFKLETLCTTRDVIWGMDFLSASADEIIFTERSGNLQICDVKTKKVRTIKGVPAVVADGQGGLLDVLVHPKTKNIYLTFSEKVSGGATTSLFKAELNKDKNLLQNGSVIFRSTAVETTDIHFGSRVIADNHDHLFMSIGERNKRDKAQDKKLHHGKILRLTLDGKLKFGRWGIVILRV